MKGFHHGGQALSAQVLRVLKENHDQFVSRGEILEDAVVQATSVISPFLRCRPPNIRSAEMAVHRAICYLRRTRGMIIACAREGGVMRYCWVE